MSRQDDVLAAVVAARSCICLEAADGSSAVVSPFGAHVLSWRPLGGAERLFLSPRTATEGAAPIRGGVPLVFPQFANLGPLPAHGLARTSVWSMLQAGPDADGASATFALTDSPMSRVLWEHAFACVYTVRIGGPRLELQWTVHNTGDRPFHFQAALHTYMQVEDIDALRVVGLQGACFEGRQGGASEAFQSEAALAVAAGIDRIYPDAPPRLRVIEPSRSSEVHALGFPDAVVWNPGAARCAAMPDMEPEGYRRMVCIEAALVAAGHSLQPGGRWSGSQCWVAMNGPMS